MKIFQSSQSSWYNTSGRSLAESESIGEIIQLNEETNHIMTL